MESRQQVKLIHVLCVAGEEWESVVSKGTEHSVFNPLTWSHPFCSILRLFEQRDGNKARGKWEGLQKQERTGEKRKGE